MRRLLDALAAVAIAGVVAAGGVAQADTAANDAAAPAAAPADAFMRGVTISCFRSGPGEWDSPQMDASLGDIQRIGATWMTFHPYGRISADGSVRHRATVDDASVLEPIAMAHARGMKVMLKPHLAYWRSGFSWRGEIRFDDERHWQRFFEQYGQFILTQARMAEAAGAAMFVVGTELKGTLHREKEWRELIAQVREVYSGELTYAANWDAYQHVPFWDALDCIGIQAYFPLTEADNPTEAQLHRGWDALLPTLEAFSRKAGKSVLFTELGYNASEHAGREPWEAKVVGDDGHAVKLRCMGVALKRIEQSPVVRGVFLWKWFPTDRDLKHDFVLQYPEMRDLIGDAWATSITSPDDTSQPIRQ